MSKISLNSIIYLLVGLIIGTVITLSIALLINNRNEEKFTTENTEKVEENELITFEKSSTNPEEFYEKVSTSTNSNTLKEGFVSIVDFLFYDKPIKGKRFSELTESAKLKILKVAVYLDDKIDKVFPDYKEKISTGTKNIYNKVKEKAIELYVNLTTKICNNHEDFCNRAREDFNNMKQTLGITWEYLKDLGISGIDKLKDWYENYRLGQ